MKRTDPESIGEIMRKAIDSSSLNEGLERARAIEIFLEAVGPAIAAQCGRPHIDGPRLVIPLRSAGLRNELSLSRSAIISHINSRLRHPLLDEIRFVSF